MNVGIGTEADAVSFLEIFVSNFRFTVFAVHAEKPKKTLTDF
jgi:hypothetical protein